MADEFTGRIRGVEELTARLRSLPPALRLRVLRNALAAAARPVRDVVRRATPVLKTSTYSGASALRRGVRKVGTVRNAIVVRTSKAARRSGDVGVFINVRPARGAGFRTTSRRVLGLKITQRTQVRASQRGAKSPNDPFYWRFLNFGWRNKPQGAGFLEAGARQLGQALQRFVQALGPQIDKFNDRGPPVSSTS